MIDIRQGDDQGMCEDILRDHLATPYHCGVLKAATLVGTKRNPACADEVTLYLSIGTSAVQEAWHQVRGCMLCKASASILCEKLHQISLADARQISEPDLVAWIGIPVSPGRLGCCVLPVQTLRQLLTSYYAD